ncbi:probable G-protein coupled receptor Mth-like 1 [Macrobrachium nipponense]|uniref:probable G-protein coupled receptor Mth-like 1 n=1 Tax=Macrobrachium nipponense TaxID=159736 RepID=UPI0030C81111
MSPSFPLFFCFFIVTTSVRALPSFAQNSLTRKSTTEVVDSNLVTNAATSLYSSALSPTVLEGETLPSVINRTESLLIPAVKSSVNESHSSVTSPTKQEASDTPTTTGETNGTEGEVSTSPTKNGALITATERTTSSISSTKMEPLLVDATEEEVPLSRTTNGANEETLFINDTPALTEKSSLIIESVGREGRNSNDVLFSDETQAFKNKSLASQLEEGKILASAVPSREVTKAVFTPPVIAKKCCESNEFWDGSNCVAGTIPFPFDPFIGATQDSESGRNNFTWETMMPNCPEDFKYQVIRLPGEDASLRANKTHSYLEWTELSMTRQTTQYCIGQQQDGDYSAVTCMADEEKVCNGGTCIRKCCPQGEVKSHTDCKPGNWNLSLSFYSLSGDESEAPRDLQLVPLVPKCPYKATVKFSSGYWLLPTGKLYLNQSGQILDNNKFCTEYYIEALENVVIHCFDQPSPVQTWKVYLAPIGMIISILCLAFLILLHFSTKKLMNVQGYCFLCYSISLLLAYVGFFVSFKYSKQLHNTHCVLNALFSQFTLHAAFFWLSVMCFDIWRVIRSSLKCIPLTGILEKDKQKFLLYASYAFGCPLVIVLVTLIIQFLPQEASAGLIVPGFGEESCWFAGELAQFLYFYLAIATLIVLSLCMLGHVIYMLCQAEPGMGCCLRKSKGPRAFNRKHLSLFRQRLMIFVLMAICWSTEVLSLKIPPKDAWVVTDLLNTLQGVIVFIIFLLSKQKRQLVKESLLKIFKKTNEDTAENQQQRDGRIRSGRFPRNFEEHSWKHRAVTEGDGEYALRDTSVLWWGWESQSSPTPREWFTRRMQRRRSQRRVQARARRKERCQRG